MSTTSCPTTNLRTPRTAQSVRKNLTPQPFHPTTDLFPLSLRCLARTLKPIRVLNIAAKVLPRRRTRLLRGKQHIANRDTFARRSAGALHASHDILPQRPANGIDRKVADLELGSIALPGEARVRVALRDVEGLQCVLCHGVAEGDVAEVAQAGAAAVGRGTLYHAGPGFDVGEVFVVVGGDVADYDVFDNLVVAGELADAAKCDACGAVKGGVFDEDVGAV